MGDLDGDAGRETLFDDEAHGPPTLLRSHFFLHITFLFNLAHTVCTSSTLTYRWPIEMVGCYLSCVLLSHHVSFQAQCFLKMYIDLVTLRLCTHSSIIKTRRCISRKVLVRERGDNGLISSRCRSGDSELESGQGKNRSLLSCFLAQD